MVEAFFHSLEQLGFIAYENVKFSYSEEDLSDLTEKLHEIIDSYC